MTRNVRLNPSRMLSDCRPPPRDGLRKHHLPSVQVISQKPVSEVFKVGNLLQNRVHKQEGESQDCRRRRFNIETGEHEACRHDGAGLGDEHQMCNRIARQARPQDRKLRKHPRARKQTTRPTETIFAQTTVPKTPSARISKAQKTSRPPATSPATVADGKSGAPESFARFRPRPPSQPDHRR